MNIYEKLILNIKKLGIDENSAHQMVQSLVTKKTLISEWTRLEKKKRIRRKESR